MIQSHNWFINILCFHVCSRSLCRKRKSRMYECGWSSVRLFLFPVGTVGTDPDVGLSSEEEREETNDGKKINACEHC